ncbi:hypothetical protein EDF62_0584 [Leucobacter luti]|uniref:Uncharacterized protein n=1 Tax=Leucobacter luti TaxID=340320 RepID=A0A4R6S7U8_9MICO|nr:hypothetical protein EDF62_0584 [Leucobacter luti]
MTRQKRQPNHSSGLPPGLANDPFSFRVTASGELHVLRGGRTVTVLRGSSAERTRARLGRDLEHDQQVLARATGNYKRGTERGRV